MDEKSKIKQYRQKQDKTLACHELVDEYALAELVKKQLLESLHHETEAEIESFLMKRTQMISRFLDMLRSASSKELEISKTRETSREWKVKQDNEDSRVMYRQGPPGTVFHDLLVEGYVDGPMDVALCVAAEVPLYKHWFPHYTIPTFNVISSECLHCVRIGEVVASVRAKVSWPISAREVLIHYFELEFFKEGLVIVIMHSLSDPDEVEKKSIGIEKVVIPIEEKGMVRMGLVGGFALQKVTNDTSYFRTMGSLDLKLSFVPSWLINFTARQLLGSGVKLYKKAVSSWINSGDQKVQQALENSMYVRVREALLSDKILTGLEEKMLVSDVVELKVLKENSESDETGNC